MALRSSERTVSWQHGSVTDNDGRAVFVEGSFPFSAVLAQSGFDVTTTSQAAIAARTGRSQVTVVNASDTPVYLGLGATAVVGNGIYLAANGGSWTEAYDGQVTAIHGGTGTKRVTFVEM